MRAGLRGLAAGATLGVAALAEAAELPMPAPDMPRLGTCGVSGGFRLPGTDGCLTTGGFVAAEAGWRIDAPTTPQSLSAPATRAAAVPVSSGRLDRPSLGASARFTADLRLPTDLGPVRVFVSLRGRNGAATDRGAR